jgi:hypothetical protein
METKVKLTDIPAKVRKMYNIERVKASKYRGEYIAIHEPSFVNCDIEGLRIEKSDACISLINKKVWVHIWLNCKNMHVTVL